MRELTEIPYVERSGHTLALDLFLPDDKSPTGLMLFVHGGGFLKGDRRGPPAERLARKLTDLGVAMASISYRLGAEDTDLSVPIRRQVYANRRRTKGCGLTLQHNLMGPRFEAARMDAGAAIAFLRSPKSPQNFGDLNIGLIGISAGGMVGLSLAFPDDNLQKFEKPACVIALGATLQNPWALSKNAPPCLMLHSCEDRIVPTRNCDILAPLIARANAPIDIQICTRKGHNAPVHALFTDDAPDGTPYWDKAQNLMRRSGVLNPSRAGV
ncbi:carboxylesterase family protein [uncultured Shimia sp.]|uniref:alpha/beta hydrolase n=1 Tax=uncultured Shimia sp. TaxID=573152 RepID=UPI002614B424|nr:carboxylesterase family protein [uncultured Shimia sp.]